MAWIEVHDTLREHRKIYALAEELKIPHYAAGGLLVFLWTWAINNAQDGDLSSYPDSAIARACFWSKSPSMLVNALIASGWLDDRRVIHDWEQYAGRLIEQREIQREQSRARQQKRRVKIGMGPEMYGVTDKHVTRDVTRDVTQVSRVNNEVTVPNLTIPNHTVGIPPLPPKGERDALFSKFWSAYPKKVAKPTAQAAFKKLNPDASLMEIILEALEKQKRSSQWTKDNGQYIPNPSTWLNQKRWEDEDERAGSNNSQPGTADHVSQYAYLGDPI